MKENRPNKPNYLLIFFNNKIKIFLLYKEKAAPLLIYENEGHTQQKFLFFFHEKPDRVICLLQQRNRENPHTQNRPRL